MRRDAQHTLHGFKVVLPLYQTRVRPGRQVSTTINRLSEHDLSMPLTMEATTEPQWLFPIRPRPQLGVGDAASTTFVYETALGDTLQRDAAAALRKAIDGAGGYNKLESPAQSPLNRLRCRNMAKSL